MSKSLPFFSILKLKCVVNIFFEGRDIYFNNFGSSNPRIIKKKFFDSGDSGFTHIHEIHGICLPFFE